MLAEVTKPAEQMGIAAQFREIAQLREIRLEIRKEATNSESIAFYRAGSQGGRESLDMGAKNLLEYRMRQSGAWADATEPGLEPSILFWGERCGNQRRARRKIHVRSN